jgi:hypothetical protein
MSLLNRIFAAHVLPGLIVVGIAAGAHAAEPIVLLDEQWDVELELQDASASPVSAGQVAGPIHSGETALRITNETGAPMVRLRNAWNLQLRGLGKEPKLQFWYRTDHWAGRWQVQLFTYYKPVANKTFALFEGELDGGGAKGALIADGQWHRAEATLTADERTGAIDGQAELPIYVMLRPIAGRGVAHETLIDRVEIVPSGEGEPDASPAEPDPQPYYFPDSRADWFTGPQTRPMSTYTTGEVTRLGPGDDVQAALDDAAPGDVFLLEPGVYHQRLTIAASGRADAPIVLAAAQPGTVTISGGPEDFDPTFEPTGHENVYVADVPWRVRAARADGRELYAYNSLEHLRDRTNQRGDDVLENLPPEGFTWEDGKLYIELSGGQDVREVAVQIHRRCAEAGQEMSNAEYWNSLPRGWRGDFLQQVLAREARLLTLTGDHLRVGGIRFDMAPEYGVVVSGDHVTVHDCYFAGMVYGVLARGASDLVVEHCEYTQYPFYEWLRWAEMETDNWSAWWGVPRHSVFVTHDGPRTRIRNNLAYGGHDLLRPRAHDSRAPEDISEYAYNFLFSAWDECVEFDTHAPLNLRVHHNFLMDAVVPLAISPVLDGPLLIDHNIAYISPEHGVKAALLKFYMIPSWKRYNTPTQRVTIAHNTGVNTQHSLYWTGEDHFFRDNVIENNIFLVKMAPQWKLPGFEVSPHNLYHGTTVNRTDHLEHLIRDRMPGFVRTPDFDTPRKPVIPLASPSRPAEPHDPNRPTVDFHLAAGSPAIDAGNPETADKYAHDANGKAPDLGAIEHGDRWRFPTPGPRWARGAMTPWRPALPASLDPAWVGLD